MYIIFYIFIFSCEEAFKIRLAWFQILTPSSINYYDLVHITQFFWVSIVCKIGINVIYLSKCFEAKWNNYVLDGLHTQYMCVYHSVCVYIYVYIHTKYVIIILGIPEFQTVRDCVNWLFCFVSLIAYNLRIFLSRMLWTTSSKDET